VKLGELMTEDKDMHLVYLIKGHMFTRHFQAFLAVHIVFYFFFVLASYLPPTNCYISSDEVTGVKLFLSKVINN
jgi:hypothetical protein